VFVAVPKIALIAAVPLAWGWGLGWHDIVLAIAFFYYISGLGVSVGLHRYFTHGSFKAARGLKIALARTRWIPQPASPPPVPVAPRRPALHRH
jgi:stearoyl-CoA desaturase (Delta-9 desaturase)